MFITKGKTDTFWRFAKPYGFKNSQMEPDERSWLRREKTVTVV